MADPVPLSRARTGRARRACLALVGPALLATRSAAAEDAETISVGATYVTDVIGDVSGGLKRGAIWLGRGDLLVDVPGAAIGLPAASFHLDIIAIQGGDFSGRYVGDAQIVSNVQAPAAIRPYEAWGEMPIGTRGLSAKVGLIDLNSEFDVQSVGTFFLNSSFGVGPDFSQSGENGPSIFPAPSAAGLLKLRRPGWSARIGVFDATSGKSRSPHDALPSIGFAGGVLVVAEGDVSIGKDREVQGGLWSFTATGPALDRVGTTGDPRRLQGQRGAYAQVEGRLVSLPHERRLDGWIRVGVADRRVEPIGFYVGGGLTAGNDAGRVGLAMARARLGAPALAAGLGAPSRRAETTVEFSYARPITGWLRMQPDIQYVTHPGWQAGVHNALVAGLRLQFTTR